MGQESGKKDLDNRVLLGESAMAKYYYQEHVGISENTQKLRSHVIHFWTTRRDLRNKNISHLRAGTKSLRQDCISAP